MQEREKARFIEHTAHPSDFTESDQLYTDFPPFFLMEMGNDGWKGAFPAIFYTKARKLGNLFGIRAHLFLLSVSFLEFEVKYSSVL